MTPSILFFIVIGAVCLASAVGVITSRIPIHSALFLLVNFVTLAIFYVTLEAQFLAAAQVIIYAGGIVVLILFVIMLIGSEKIETRASHRTWTPFVGILLGVTLIASMIYAFVETPSGATATSTINGGAPETVGMALFTRYILPFEMTAILLLVALLGALLLARYQKANPDL
ncbi:MAG: NADH-quinone oxidoreductase subunit J [Caldilineaceae bacterium]|nr:NADH-quinone oxidoreductase subunit J [Caldilineaceae bacterium]